MPKFNWKQRTRDYEKFMPRVYDDDGQKAIGYGSQLASHPNIDPDIVSGKRDMTTQEAEELFAPDYELAMSHAKEYAGPKWDELSENRKGILTDMAYNMMKGPSVKQNGLSKFGNMRRMILEGKVADAGPEMLRGSAPDGRSLYAVKVGTRATENSRLWNE
jgi:GH24 family phage-related lysozyme (muramidase)